MSKVTIIETKNIRINTHDNILVIESPNGVAKFSRKDVLPFVQEMREFLSKLIEPTLQAKLTKYEKLLDEYDIPHMLCTNRVSNSEREILIKLQVLMSDNE